MGLKEQCLPCFLRSQVDGRIIEELYVYDIVTFFYDVTMIMPLDNSSCSLSVLNALLQLPECVIIIVPNCKKPSQRFKASVQCILFGMTDQGAVIIMIVHDNIMMMTRVFVPHNCKL